jgi:5-methylcytosine-specific restriction protein A
VSEFQLPWGSTKKSRKDAKKLYDKFDRSPESVQHHNSKRWKDARLEVLQGEPLCRRCKERGFYREAKLVDHIVPRSQIPIEEWYDKDNLQPLCWRCHNIKTAEDYKKYGKT